MAEHTALLSILVEEIAEDTLMERIQSNISVASDSIHVGSSAALSLVRDMIRDPVRVEGYVPDVVNHYSDIEFKSHFRMKRSTFEQLCTDVAPYMRRERTMKLETKMLATLWMLGNLECYRSVADRFGISKGTLHLTVISTCKAISSLKTDYIKFPENRTEMDAIAEGFHKRCGMPGVVGAIDGTHIPVPAPTSEHRASFINRKGFSSIQLQVVCDSNLKLLDTYTGWPGSVHDARVYRNRNRPIERRGTQRKGQDIVCIRNVILAKYSSITVNGSDFYNSVVQSTSILTTGIKRLDNVLDGGLYTGEVTEIAGDVAAGKTQLSFSVCAATAKQANQTVVYIDTGAVFSASRVLQMIPNNSSLQEDILSRIHVYDAFTIHDVFSVLDSIDGNIQAATDPFYSELKLVIVDNIASVVYPFLGGSSFSESQGLLSLLGQKLKSLAVEYSVAVMITNNVVKGDQGTRTASLGRLWSHIPHVRMIVTHTDQYGGSTRNVTVVKNSRGGCNVCGELNIGENGPIT